MKSVENLLYMRHDQNKTNHNSQLSTHNSELSPLTSELSTLTSELSTLNTELSTLNSQLSTLHKSIDMLPQKESIIKQKSEAFSIRVIKMYKYLSSHMNERVLSKQILRSGTSVGANVNESRNAQSTSDFISKLSIALKEADETTYWLKCLYGGEYITEAQYLSMNNDIQEIVRILVKIIKTTKERNCI